MSTDHNSDAPPNAAKAKPISAKDVASGSAIGSALRLGSARRKSMLGEGVAAGAASGAKRNTDRGSLMTALFVVVVMLGSLALMLLFGR